VGAVRLLVTGASGFVGGYVVERALEAGHEVRTVSRSSWSRRGAESLKVDLHDEPALAAALAGIDAVIHLAVAGRASEDATATLIRAMQAQGTRRLVLVSSLAVYDYSGLREGGVLDESSPLEPHPERRDEYCRVKLQQEAVARTASFELVVLRPGAIIGPGRLWTARIGQRIGPLTLVVGGGALVPVCYVENVADAIVRAAERPEARGTTLNLVDDELPTQNEYLRAIKSTGTVGGPALPVPRGVALGVARVASLVGSRVRLPNALSERNLEARTKPFSYSNQRAKEVLGWTPSVSVNEAVRRSSGAPGRGLSAS
jgi:nucleoside-diphosphate-sugar epimerase